MVVSISPLTLSLSPQRGRGDKRLPSRSSPKIPLLPQFPFISSPKIPLFPQNSPLPHKFPSLGGVPDRAGWSPPSPPSPFPSPPKGGEGTRGSPLALPPKFPSYHNSPLSLPQKFPSSLQFPSPKIPLPWRGARQGGVVASISLLPQFPSPKIPLPWRVPDRAGWSPPSPPHPFPLPPKGARGQEAPLSLFPQNSPLTTIPLSPKNSPLTTIPLSLWERARVRARVRATVRARVRAA